MNVLEANCHLATTASQRHGSETGRRKSRRGRSLRSVGNFKEGVGSCVKCHNKSSNMRTEKKGYWIWHLKGEGEFRESRTHVAVD